MAYINITINTGAGDSTSQANQRMFGQATGDSTKPFEGVNLSINELSKVLSGCEPASIAVAVTNVDPSVSAAGGGSSATYNLN